MKKVLVVIILVVAIVGGIIFLQKTSKKEPLKPVAGVEYSVATDKAFIKKNITDIDALVEIPNKDKAKVIQIKDIKAVQKIDEIFKKAYKDDLIIFLPDKTIIYDPSTRTIRDISSKILYENFDE